SWADETFRRRDMRSLLSLRQMTFRTHSNVQDSDDPDAVVRDGIVEDVRPEEITPHARHDFAVVRTERRLATKSLHGSIKVHQISHCDVGAPAPSGIDPNPVDIPRGPRGDPQPAGHPPPGLCLGPLETLDDFLHVEVVDIGTVDAGLERLPQPDRL